MASPKHGPLNPDAPSFYVETSKPSQGLNLPIQLYYHQQPLQHPPAQPLPEHCSSPEKFVPYPGQVYSHSGLFYEQTFMDHSNLLYPPPQTFYPQTQPRIVYSSVSYYSVAASGCRGGDEDAESEVVEKVEGLEKGFVGVKFFERGGFSGSRRESTFRSGKTNARVWKRKIKSNCDEAATINVANDDGGDSGVHSPPSPAVALPLPSDDVSFRGKTTIMVKNIPNQFRRNMLIELFDKLCHEQNQKAKLLFDPLHFAYDFVYLPMDFRTGDNLGYAFVNFTSSGAATRIREVLHKYRWFYITRKICESTWARIQGKEQLVKHFKNSRFPCYNMQYLPAVFSPPRNGTTSLTMPTTIGKCLASEGK